MSIFIQLSADFSAEILQATESAMINLNWWKGKTYTQEYTERL